MKQIAPVFVLLALVACQDIREPVAPTIDVPSLAVSARGQVVPGRFIVTVRDGVDPAGMAAEHGVSADFVYRHALNGFAGAMSDAARNGLLRDGRILRVEPDQVMSAIATTQDGAT